MAKKTGGAVEQQPNAGNGRELPPDTVPLAQIVGLPNGDVVFITNDAVINDWLEFATVVARLLIQMTMERAAREAGKPKIAVPQLVLPPGVSLKGKGGP